MKNYSAEEMKGLRITNVVHGPEPKYVPRRWEDDDD